MSSRRDTDRERQRSRSPVSQRKPDVSIGGQRSVNNILWTMEVLIFEVFKNLPVNINNETRFRFLSSIKHIDDSICYLREAIRLASEDWNPHAANSEPERLELED